MRFTAINSIPARISLSLLLGLLTNLAFAPFGLFFVIYGTLALLFLFWNQKSPKECAFMGFAFGFGLYSVGLSWLYISVHEFGGAALIPSVLVVVLLACIMALFCAAAGYLQAKVLVSERIRYLMLIPTIWVLLEWCRQWFLTGFPWLYIGYSQIDTPLSGFAPILSVLGVSLALAMTSGAIVLLIKTPMDRIAAVSIAVLFAAGFLGKSINWIEQENEKVRVALLQGDVSVHTKWNRAKARGQLNFFVRSSTQLSDQDLIVWPEAALAYSNIELEKLLLWEYLQDLSPDFLVGVLEETNEGQQTIYHNSAYGISDNLQVYRKRHLVPFGEYIPFRALTNWVNKFVDIPGEDILPYKSPQKPLQLAGAAIGVSICYEDAFPAEVRNMLPEATLLVNISEDAWFGEYLAPHQRLQMSRMRAIESARPMVRVANKGISASIDHLGNIVDLLEQREGRVLKTIVTPTTGVTPFVRYGSVPILAICIVLLALSVAYHVRSSDGN